MITVNSEIFSRILFLQIASGHICDVKYSQLEHDLTISVNNRVITPFREGLIFMKLRISEVSLKINSHENLRIYSINVLKSLLLHNFNKIVIKICEKYGSKFCHHSTVNLLLDVFNHYQSSTATHYIRAVN